MSATQDQIEECFNTLDKEKRGSITREQLVLGIRALGKNPNEKEMKEVLDDIGNSAIDLAKFKASYRSCKGRAPIDQEREMRAAFTALDANNNGRILETELRQILGNLGDALNSQEVNSLMREAKVSDDGLVDYNSFVDMLVHSYPVGDYLSKKG